MIIKKYRKYKNVKPEINLTSMIDVMSILMSVFMVTAPMLTTGINVNLPKGGKSVIEGSEKAIDIIINKNGNIYIGNNEVKKNNLSKTISSMLKENPKLNIVISGDANTYYNKIVDVMSILKNAGFKKIGLKTELETVIKK